MVNLYIKQEILLQTLWYTTENIRMTLIQTDYVAFNTRIYTFQSIYWVPVMY